jgi:NADH-quinone oxidoreductase subunit N
LFGAAKVPPALVGLMVALPLASIVWGNIAAIRQSSFRRMIAYSSIAHAGYLYFAFLGAPGGRFQSIAFYVAAYALANLLAFAALPRLAQSEAGDRIDSLRGVFARSPFAALMLGLAMLSLAGIPPLPGFVAKFLIFRNVMEAGYTLYAVLGLVGSYLGIYFYLRVIQYAFMSTPAEAGAAPGAALPARGPAIAAAVLCLVPVALLMLFPGALLSRL